MTTRDEILRVSIELFTRKGFEGTSIRDIAEAMGMAKSSLYNHFASKDDIVASLMADRRDEVAELLEWISTQPKQGLLRAAALRWLDRTTPERLQGMRLAQANQPVIGRLGGPEMRSTSDQAIDAILGEDAPPEDRLYAQLVFGTANATLMAAQGSQASPKQILAVARRAVLALTA